MSTNAWVIFDFKRPMKISGIRIFGWSEKRTILFLNDFLRSFSDEDSTPHRGQIEISNTRRGPWFPFYEFRCSYNRKLNFSFHRTLTRLCLSSSEQSTRFLLCTCTDTICSCLVFRQFHRCKSSSEIHRVPWCRSSFNRSIESE